MNSWTDKDVEIGLLAARANARREALEEAAKVCEAIPEPPFRDVEWVEARDVCVGAIRALMEPKP